MLVSFLFGKIRLVGYIEFFGRLTWDAVHPVSSRQTVLVVQSHVWRACRPFQWVDLLPWSGYTGNWQNLFLLCLNANVTGLCWVKFNLISRKCGQEFTLLCNSTSLQVLISKKVMSSANKKGCWLVHCSILRIYCLQSMVVYYASLHHVWKFRIDFYFL